MTKTIQSHFYGSGPEAKRKENLARAYAKAGFKQKKPKSRLEAKE